MATVSNRDSSAGGDVLRVWRFWPRSLRWRLQLWLTCLLVCVLAAMIATGYELQRVNRFRQIDADVQVRLASLSGSVREFYHDGPPPPERRGPGRSSGPGHTREPEDFGRQGRRPPPHRPPDDRPPPGAGDPFGPPPRGGPAPTLQLSPETAGLFGADAGYYFTIWYRDGSVVDRSQNAPSDLPP